MKPIDADSEVRPARGVYARAFGEDLVLLDFAKGEYFALEGAGADIWRSLEAGLPLRRIADTIVERYDVTRDLAIRDIVDLVDALARRALLEVV